MQATAEMQVLERAEPAYLAASARVETVETAEMAEMLEMEATP